MFHIVLFQPEIPPNTGNIVRLVANTGATLHLVKPLGFSLDEKAVRRAGMDYSEFAAVQVHEDWQALVAALPGRRLLAFSTRATRSYHEFHFQAEDVLVFGPETRGLPQEVLESFDDAHRLRLPMRPGNRSVNLSNTVAVALFEAWRQHNFSGGV